MKIKLLCFYILITCQMACDLPPKADDDEIPTDGLALYLPFDGNTKNLSPIPNVDGISSGGIYTVDRHGRNSRALELDGLNDFIQVPSHDRFNFDKEENFTISIWIKPSTEQLNLEEHKDILSKWEFVQPTTKAYPFSMRYASTENKLYSARYDECSNVACCAESDQAINDGNFHHIIYMKDGANLSFYLDGRKTGETQDSTTCTTKSAANLIVGRRHVDSIDHTNFKGAIDDLRIYDRALSSGEILLLLNEQ